MARIHFSLKGLLAFVGFVALGCVALFKANAWWATGLLSATTAALFVGVLAMAVRRGPAQSFWLGFVICGGGYFWAAHWPNKFEGGIQGMTSKLELGENYYGPHQNLSTTQVMLTSHKWFVRWAQGPGPQGAVFDPNSGWYQPSPNAGGGGFGAGPLARVVRPISPTRRDFMAVG